MSVLAMLFCRLCSALLRLLKDKVLDTARLLQPFYLRVELVGVKLYGYLKLLPYFYEAFVDFCCHLNR